MGFNDIHGQNKVTVTLNLGRCLCVLLNRPFPLDLLARQTGRPEEPSRGFHGTAGYDYLYFDLRLMLGTIEARLTAIDDDN